MSRLYNPDVITAAVDDDLDLRVRPDSERLQEADFCAKIASDTKNCLLEMADTPSGLPADKLAVREDQFERDYITSPTNIGLYLASLVAMRDMDMLSSDQADSSVDGVLDALDNLEKNRGLYFNWYDARTGDTGPAHGDKIVSTVDNAWLAIGLMAVRNAGFGIPNEHAGKLFDDMDLSALYDPDGELFYGHYNATNGAYSAYHNDVLLSETRVASYLGMVKHGLPPEHFYSLGRFVPAGHPEPDHDPTDGIKSWGGSMFEVLMPTLFVDESFSGDLKQAHHQQVKAQIAYGDRHLGGHWGVSVCLTPKDGYQELGISSNAMSGAYQERGVITPHAKLLALPYARETVLAGLMWDLENYPDCYNDGLGFYDSFDIFNGVASDTYLVLDQAMGFLALCNDRQKGPWQYTSHELTAWAAGQDRSIGSLAVRYQDAA